MDCDICRQLKAERDRLEIDHTEKSKVIDKNWQMISQRERNHLKSTRSDARLSLEIARARLRRHKRDEHGEEYSSGAHI